MFIHSRLNGPLSGSSNGYPTISSLASYLLIGQESPTAIVHQRTEQGFVRNVYAGLNAVILLPEMDARLPLAEIYEGESEGDRTLRDEPRRALNRA